MQMQKRTLLMMLLVILILSLSIGILAGCKIQFGTGLETGMTTTDSETTSTPAETTLPETSAETTAGSLLSADLQKIKHLLTLHNADALAYMGGDYTETPASVDGWMEGYYYPASGLTLCFYPTGLIADPEGGIPAEDLDRCIIVYCESMTDANGTHVGMTPNQIKAVLGEPTKIFLPGETTPMTTYLFFIDGIEISYVSIGDDEATSTLYVKFPLIVTG